LILAGSGDEREIFVSAIVRDENGRPIELAEPIKPVAASLQVVSASWVNPTSIGYLESAGDAYTNVSIQTIGGINNTLPRIEAGSKIMGNSSSNAIYVLNARGEFYQQRGISWTLIRDLVTAAHFPGI
jgi:hypothetical protein